MTFLDTLLAELLDRDCGRVRYDLVNRLTRTVKDFQQNLCEEIDLTLALHQSSKNDVEYNLGELSKQIGSVATIPSELLANNSAIEEIDLLCHPQSK